MAVELEELIEEDVPRERRRPETFREKMYVIAMVLTVVVLDVFVIPSLITGWVVCVLIFGITGSHVYMWLVLSPIMFSAALVVLFLLGLLVKISITGVKKAIVMISLCCHRREEHHLVETNV